MFFCSFLQASPVVIRHHTSGIALNKGFPSALRVVLSGGVAQRCKRGAQDHLGCSSCITSVLRRVESLGSCQKKRAVANK